MTHRAAPNRFRLALLAALATAVPFAPSTAGAQTQAQGKTKPPGTTPQAFTAGLKVARKQAEVLVKQGTDKSAKAQKQVSDAQASLAKLQGGPQSDAVKQKALELQAVIVAGKEQAAKLEKVAHKLQELLPLLDAALAAQPCSSPTKGVKGALAPVRLNADGVVGSAASEIAQTRSAEKTTPFPKLKTALAAYANDVQSLAKLTSALSGAVMKLEEQAVTLPACP